MLSDFKTDKGLAACMVVIFQDVTVHATLYCTMFNCFL